MSGRSAAFLSATPVWSPHRPAWRILIGDDVDRWEEYLAEDGAALHLYNKGEARPGRKMGHVTRFK